MLTFAFVGFKRTYVQHEPLESDMQTLSQAEVAKALFNSAAAIDELGFIKAQIAELEAKEKALTDALKATGADKFTGDLWDATVSRTERETVDTKRLRADLGEDIISGYVKRSPVVTLRLVAKK